MNEADKVRFSIGQIPCVSETYVQGYPADIEACIERYISMNPFPERDACGSRGVRFLQYGGGLWEILVSGRCIGGIRLTVAANAVLMQAMAESRSPFSPVVIDLVPYVRRLTAWLEANGFSTRDVFPCVRTEEQTRPLSLSEVETKAPGASGNSGPTVKTVERFHVFKQLKDVHPTWNQQKVAMEAGSILGETLFDSTVRNTYKAMGEAWPRGDRVR